MARFKAFDEGQAIDAAVDCFWARGYEATSVRDLIEHMGIGGASLYNAYGDKRALFAMALERYANCSMRARIASAPPAASAFSKAVRMRRRMSVASSIFFRPGAAPSRSSRPKWEYRAPAASTRWS